MKCLGRGAIFNIAATQRGRGLTVGKAGYTTQLVYKHLFGRQNRCGVFLHTHTKFGDFIETGLPLSTQSEFQVKLFPTISKHPHMQSVAATGLTVIK